MEQLRSAGRFEEFVEQSASAAEAEPRVAGLQLIQAEALLAIGCPREAEAAAAAAMDLIDPGEPAILEHAARLWSAARFRQNEPFAASLCSLQLARLRASDSACATLRFWIDAIGNRTAYRIDSTGSNAPLRVASAAGEPGSLAAQLNAIQARANGTLLPLVFIDTGAGHTVMTREAAAAAGVKLSSAGTQLVGFAGFQARPGLLDALDLGGLVLRDVPVLVGNSPPLVESGGQMALGAELMHHVRFTIDYRRNEVFADRAELAPKLYSPQNVKRIPLWTFSHAALTLGKTEGGSLARVLVDTGNRAGSFASTRWSRRTFPQLRRPTSKLVFHYKHRDWKLNRLTIGDVTLDDWPLVDRVPHPLEGLNLVDLLIGRDMLAPYRLTIDMRRRLLELEGDVDPVDRTTSASLDQQHAGPFRPSEN